MNHRYALWWWTLDRQAATPWPRRCLQAETIEGKRRHLQVAIIEETSSERAWRQVLRIFPDYRPHREIEVGPDCTLERLVRTPELQRGA